MATPVGNSDYGYNRWKQDYDAYLQKIEQYKGSSFYDELLNNPYYQYQDYNENWFQRIWANITGDHAGWDKFYNDRQTSGDEYMSQVLDAMRQQGYNDPSAQVARRQAAGLNDDLSGGDAISAGETGSVAPDDTPPVTEDNDGVTALLQVGSSVAKVGFDLFQSSISMISFLQDLESKKINNARNDVAFTDELENSILSMMANTSSMPGSREEYESLTEEERNGLDLSMIQSLESAITSGSFKGAYTNKRAREMARKLKGVLVYDKDGKPTLGYTAYRNKLMATAYGDLKTAAGVIGTPGFNEDITKFGEAIANTFGNIDLSLRKAEERLRNAQATSAEAKANYDAGAYTFERGQSDAATGVAVNDARQVQAQNRKIIEDMRKEINDEFERLRLLADSKQGLEKLILKLLIPYARNRVNDIVENGVASDLGQVAGAAGTAAGILLK